MLILILHSKLSLLKQYSDKHPDVLRLQKQINTLQDALLKTNDTEDVKVDILPDNPAYITLQAQLESIHAELTSLTYTRNQVLKRSTEIRESLRQAPLVEKEYVDLIQDLDSNNLRYREVSARKMEAEISQQLEVERKGERFTLIDPPQEPLEALSPNRPAIFFLGFIFAIAGGIGCVFLAEMLGATVNNEKTITALLGVAPLASIPYLESEEEQNSSSKRNIIILTSGLIILILAVTVFHFVVMPLDVFWYKLLRVIDNI